MKQLLIVCTGNTCRSPMLEGLARKKIKNQNLDNKFQVSSAGTSIQEGNPAAEHVITILAEKGIDLSAHRTRLINHEILENSDIVLTMTNAHKNMILEDFPDQKAKIFLFSEMVGENLDISDPYMKPIAKYIKTAEELTSILDRGFKEILNRLLTK